MNEVAVEFMQQPGVKIFYLFDIYTFPTVYLNGVGLALMRARPPDVRLGS